MFRHIPLYIIFSLILSGLFISSFSSHAINYTGEYLTYTENEDGTLTVTGYNRSKHESPYDLVVPNIYDNKTVVAIGAHVFEEQSFNSISIGSDININDYAFANATFNNNNITLNGSSITIGNGAFMNSNLFTFTCENLYSLGENAFSGTYLTSFNIHSSLKQIGKNAFPAKNFFLFIVDMAVTDLTKYEFSFSSMSNPLFHVHANSTLIPYLEKNYFSYYISELLEYHYAKAKPGSIIDLEGLDSFGNKITFAKAKIIDDSNAIIIDYLYDCKTVTFLNDSLSVDTNYYSISYNGHNYHIYGIASNAFDNCVSLSTLFIDSPIDVINSNAFSNCKNLQSIKFKQNVGCVEANAFYNSPSLRVFLAVTNINYNNYNFTNLTNASIYINNTPCSYSEYTYYTTVLAGTPPKKGDILTIKNQKYKVNNNSSVTYIGPAKKNQTSITLPNTITYIGVTYKITKIAAKSCYKCTKLKKVTIGNNVTEIGDLAFANCSKLTSITFGSKVTKLGKKVLYNDKKLKTITFKSKKIKSIGKGTFKGVPKTVNIRVPNSKVTTYKKLIRKATK